jgi:hypothetical protein
MATSAPTVTGRPARTAFHTEVTGIWTVFPTARAPGVVGRRLPGNDLTGGTRRSGKPTRGNRWPGEVLTDCTWARGPQPPHLPVGAVLPAGPAIGTKKAAIAVGHSISVIAWHMLADDSDYADPGGDYSDLSAPPPHIASRRPVTPRHRPPRASGDVVPGQMGEGDARWRAWMPEARGPLASPIRARAPVVHWRCAPVSRSSATAQHAASPGRMPQRHARRPTCGFVLPGPAWSAVGAPW